METVGVATPKLEAGKDGCAADLFFSISACTAAVAFASCSLFFDRRSPQPLAEGVGFGSEAAGVELGAVSAAGSCSVCASGTASHSFSPLSVTGGKNVRGSGDI